MVKISSIVIGVSDLKRARPFYEHVLGMVFEEFRPPFASALLDGVEFNIEENSSDRSSDWGTNYIGGRKPIGFKVEDMDAFLDAAKVYGVRIVVEPHSQPWGWREVVIADSDNNEFIIEQQL